MEAVMILGWIILSLVVGNMGSTKSIGSTSAFFISLFFSPLIGLLFVIASNPITKKKINPEIVKLTNKAIDLKKKDLIGALLISKQALNLDPTNSKSHFNLACFYSLSNDKQNSFKHISKAVEFKFPKIVKIQTDPDLEWIRNQPEFNDFASNGYELPDDDLKFAKRDYIDELKELSKLKNDGILTESEFEGKKAEILKDK